jgi:hypothetical protein
MIHEVMGFKMWLGLIGPAGPAGPPGRDVQLRGPVATVYDLPVTAPASELWQVGTQAPYNGYFFNGTSWVNLGPVAAGPPGPAGEDGVSPEISVTDITGGHRITITDATGTETFDVMDGTDGATGPAGPGVPSGGSTGQVLKKKSAADYDTEWANAGTADALPLAGGTMSGNINMDGNRVQNLPTPSANGDAVTKSYADGLLTGYRTASAQDVIDASKQDTLVSGTNIKTVGGQSLLGSGDIDVGGALYFTGVAISATTGDFASVNNAKITDDHVVAECVFANPSAITTDVSWVTANQGLVLNGTCTSATTANIVLVKKNN